MNDMKGLIERDEGLAEAARQAVESHRLVAVGGGVGAALGAVLGGPVGAAVGGAVGGMVGALLEGGEEEAGRKDD